jgi:hypothetical protein
MGCVVTAIRIGLVIVMAVAIATMSGCGSSEARNVEKALEEKYGEKFKVSVLTGFLHRMQGNDPYGYAYPKSNPESEFYFAYPKDEDGSGGVLDDYTLTVFNVNVAKRLEEMLGEGGVKAAIDVDGILSDKGNDDDLALKKPIFDISKWKDNVDTEDIWVRILIDKKETASPDFAGILANGIEGIYDETGLPVVTNVYIVKKDFEENEKMLFGKGIIYSVNEDNFDDFYSIFRYELGDLKDIEGNSREIKTPSVSEINGYIKEGYIDPIEQSDIEEEKENKEAWEAEHGED